MSQGSPPLDNHRANPWLSAAVRIHRITNEFPGVKTYDLEFVDAERSREFAFAHGQFNMLYVPGVGEAAISICGRTDDGMLRHTIRNAGAVTGELDRGKVGMSLGLRGPFGSAWPVHKLDASHIRDVIIVAGGIGLAPLRSLITHLKHNRDQVDRVDVLIGARTPQDLLYDGEYAGWADHDISVRTTVDRATPSWRGEVGVVTLVLDRIEIPRPETTILVTCGPEVMMRYVASAALRRGVPESNLWVSLERNMNCAIGLCGHCQMGPEFVCKDGPVFRYDRVKTWLRTQDL